MTENFKIPYYRPPKIMNGSANSFPIDCTWSDIDRRSNARDMADFPIIAHSSKNAKLDTEHDFEPTSIDLDRQMAENGKIPYYRPPKNINGSAKSFLIDCTWFDIDRM
jgi:hypothetical protein